MSDVVIRAEGLGKKYVIGHQTNERYTALRDVLARQARRFARSARDMAAGRPLIMGDEREEFWALKDLNFEIRRGEVVGIIGRNGAGKSTLLKVLSRITEPSEGRVTIDGRVASLLEVGTGFHPELTGRENIYLNGAILGMTRAEIRSKFDEIVDFAGVEKFLDTPVKRYSSGMYVRLAFSVAAHLEPEILVVDEVLAVGDAEFQKKCLGKMKDVAGGGRTVLFVSHNMAAIQTLCGSAIYLRDGTVELIALATEVVRSYLQTDIPEGEYIGNPESHSPGIAHAFVSDENHNKISLSYVEKPIYIDFKIANIFPQKASLTVIISDYNGNDIIHSTDEFSSPEMSGVSKRRCVIPKNLLRPGQYTVSAALFDRSVEIYQPITQLFKFSIQPSGPAYSINDGKWRGLLSPQLPLWEKL